MLVGRQRRFKGNASSTIKKYLSGQNTVVRERSLHVGDGHYEESFVIMMVFAVAFLFDADDVMEQCTGSTIGIENPTNQKFILRGVTQ